MAIASFSSVGRAKNSRSCSSIRCLTPASIPWPVTSRNPISRKISSMRPAALAAAAVSCSIPVAKAATSTTGSDGVVTSRILRAARNQRFVNIMCPVPPRRSRGEVGVVGSRLAAAGERGRATTRWGGRNETGSRCSTGRRLGVARGPHRSGHVRHDGPFRGRRDSGRPRHARRDQRPVLEPADVRRRPARWRTRA